MDTKQKRGFTLIELIITVSVLMVVIAAAGSAMAAMLNHYAQSRAQQNRQINARLALLSMTREIHRGVTGMTDDDVGSNKLRLRMYDGTLVTYGFDGTQLTRAVTQINAEGEEEPAESPVQFVPAEIQGFESAIGKWEPSGSPIKDGRFVSLRIRTQDSSDLSTTVSILRIPQ